MKKIFKLIILAAVLVGAVVGLMFIIDPGKKEDSGPIVQSAEAKEWKEKINALCQDGKWSVQGYNSISTGIHTDWKTSQGELISKDEENTLRKYLYTASCNCLNKEVNQLFKQSTYPAGKLKSVEDMDSFLNSQSSEFGSDSNLSEASRIISEYHQLLGSLSFNGTAASYSHPLRAFNATSADAVQSRIKSLKYYSSHFSKNPSVRSKVDNLSSDRARAESDYYMNLEKAIENHYRSTRDLGVLLDDQIRFEQISTNDNAKTRLNSFVNNPDR